MSEREPAYIGRLSLGRIQYSFDSSNLPDSLIANLGRISEAEGFDEWLPRVMDSKYNSFPLGVIASTVPLQDLPQLRGFLNPVQVGKYIKIKPHQARSNARAWSLCDNAEPYLNEAVEKQKFTVISEGDTPLLLMKHVGIRTAVCLRNFETALGTGFVKGNWYEPFDYDTVRRFRSAARDGKSQAQIQPGTWVLLRSVSGFDLSPEAKSAIGV
jgi:hypothetical protein